MVKDSVVRPCAIPSLAPVPDDNISYLLASLHYISLTEVGYVRCLRRVCVVTVPSSHWGAPFEILFALPCEEGLACLRSCTPIGFIRPQTASHLAGMLGVSLRELAFFPRCREAALLRLLFRYCAALLQWQLVTPRRRMSIPWKTWRWEEWTCELSAALALQPVSRLYSMPAEYYRLIGGSVPGAAVSLEDLPHHLLAARIGSGKKLAPHGWVYALIHTAAPFSLAGHALRAWLALSHY